MSKTSYKPADYPTITPYLIIRGAAGAIDFYKKAFDAKVTVRMDGPDGKLAHGELQIGESRFMLGEEQAQMGIGFKSPATVGGNPVSIYLYVPDVDQVIAKAVAAGAKILMPVKDQFYGDRTGFIEDPYGHLWTVATRVEEVTPEMMKERMKTMAPPA
jgi:PhnB protein